MRLLRSCVYACCTLLLLNNGYAETDKWEPEYSIKIKECDNDVYELDENEWIGASFLYFLNHSLYGTHDTLYKSESEADVVKGIVYSGNVNLIYSPAIPEIDDEGEYSLKPELFKCIFQDENTPSISVDLWLNTSKFYKLPRIKAITENSDISPQETYQYRYVIELNDNTIWLTPSLSKPVDLNTWEMGAQILIIRNSDNVCFINRDALMRADLPVVESKHCLFDLEIVKE